MIKNCTNVPGELSCYPVNPVKSKYPASGKLNRVVLLTKCFVLLSNTYLLRTWLDIYYILFNGERFYFDYSDIIMTTFFLWQQELLLLSIA